ncbi:MULTISPECIES: peroxiredoxin-like family protein [unclassified Synechocystis]|uniref:peroxiredoxin-like family protein n=1 Tax=unclassified Synechocystis TaxID=2640012 RepID=UPI000412553D|nr:MULTISPECIES: peroxiredoxin-like family protein [unclassified Synechocystis]AIE74289.1 Peroxiredoxin [Synechocystis sp. PCC 6714]MCT0254922.1 AhpC/TSA family protein [Synechocystis sp. CS-94]
MNLQIELYKFHQESLQKTTSERAAVFSAFIQGLREEFTNRRQLRIGDFAPDFTLPNTQGELVSLSEQLKHGPVLLKFFRGYWCPYCGLELRAYQKIVNKIRALGGTILAISPQTLAASQKTIDRHDLTYDLLSDHGLQTAQEYGLVFTVPDAVKQAYLQSGCVIPEHNGIDAWLLPVPATFVIDRQGHIALAYVNVDFRIRYEPEDAIAILLSLFVDN